MSQNYEFYNTRANEAAAEAAAATLEKVRERALRSEMAWREMADRAKQMVNDAIEDFRAHGIDECVNDDWTRKTPNYVSSATNLYAASQWVNTQQ